MLHYLKGFVAVTMAATMCASVSLSALSASAADWTKYHGTTYKDTSGGDGGYVKIRARAFTEYYQPHSGVNVYYYGTVADISTGSSLKTNFVIDGTVTRGNASARISKSGTGNSVRAEAITSSPDSYNHVASTVDTNSASFGKSHQECNFDL